MTDRRTALFDTIRPFTGGRSFTREEVRTIDALADNFGIPRLAAPPSRPPKPAASPKVAKATLTGLVGASAAAALLAGLTQWEGKRNVGYVDIAGIPTACMGDTKNVVVGKFYTDAECQARLEAQAMTHAGEVLKCTPSLRGKDGPLVAAGLLAYNIGGGAYCRSTVDRRFDAGQWRAGCDAFLAWNKARVKGKITVVRGLANRREFERTICLKGLPA